MWTEILAALAAVAAALAAVVAAAFAWLSWKRAGDALTRADEQTAVARDANVVARQANAMLSEANRTTLDANKVTANALATSEERQSRIDARAVEYHSVHWTAIWGWPTPTTPGGVVGHPLVIANFGVDDALDVRIEIILGAGVDRTFHFQRIAGQTAEAVHPVDKSKYESGANFAHLDPPEMEKKLQVQGLAYLDMPIDVVINWRTEAGNVKQEIKSLECLRGIVLEPWQTIPE